MTSVIEKKKNKRCLALKSFTPIFQEGMVTRHCRFSSSCVSGRGNRIGPVFPSFCLSVCQFVSALTADVTMSCDVTKWCQSGERTTKCMSREVRQRWGVFIRVYNISWPVHTSTQKTYYRLHTSSRQIIRLVAFVCLFLLSCVNCLTFDLVRSADLWWVPQTKVQYIPPPKTKPSASI